MSYVYFPGCKYTELSPEISAKIKDYFREKLGMRIAGCCRTNHSLLTEQDTALVVCPTCLSNLKDTAPQAEIQSVWELLAEDDQFPWPDYKGREITVQDCKDTCNNRKLQDGVRKILGRMNVNIVELDKSFEKADYFCNVSPQNTEAKIKEDCQSYTTDTVVCYCTGCFNALKIGEVNGLHLMNLIMGED